MTGRPENEEERIMCTTEVYDLGITPWDEIKKDIVRIETVSSGEGGGLEEEDLKEAFENPDTVAILLRNAEGTIVGFTFAEPTENVYTKKDYPRRERSKDTVYISDSTIDPDYQHQGFIGPMMEQLESQLVEKGYKFIERDSADTENEDGESYADKITKIYEGRHRSTYGKQAFFRTKLKEPDKK